MRLVSIAAQDKDTCFEGTRAYNYCTHTWWRLKTQHDWWMFIPIHAAETWPNRL